MGVSSHFNSKVTETAELAVSPFPQFFSALQAMAGPPQGNSPPKKVLMCKKMPKRMAAQSHMFCCTVMKHGCLPGDVLFATWWFGK